MYDKDSPVLPAILAGGTDTAQKMPGCGSQSGICPEFNMVGIVLYAHLHTGQILRAFNFSVGSDAAEALICHYQQFQILLHKLFFQQGNEGFV